MKTFAIAGILGLTAVVALEAEPPRKQLREEAASQDRTEPEERPAAKASPARARPKPEAPATEPSEPAQPVSKKRATSVINECG